MCVCRGGDNFFFFFFLLSPTMETGYCVLFSWKESSISIVGYNSVDKHDQVYICFEFRNWTEFRWIFIIANIILAKVLFQMQREFKHFQNLPIQAVKRELLGSTWLTARLLICNYISMNFDAGKLKISNYISHVKIWYHEWKKRDEY